jgi:hypothetical protein
MPWLLELASEMLSIGGSECVNVASADVAQLVFAHPDLRRITIIDIVDARAERASRDVHGADGRTEQGFGS